MEVKEVKLVPKSVEYCSLCSMPTEYCEYSKKKCSGKTEKAKPDADDTEKTEQKQEEAPKVKPLIINVLLHEKKNRGITQISGLEQLNTDTKDLGKKLTKKFGCGSGTITKDTIELQGLYKENLVDFFAKEFKTLCLGSNNFVFEDKVKNKKKKAAIEKVEKA